MSDYSVSEAPKESYPDLKPFVLPEQQGYLDEAAKVFVAEKENEQKEKEVCGVLLAVEEERGLRVLSLHVKEEHRRSGVASMLLETAESCARALGKGRVYVDYTASFEEAMELQDFYVKRGYVMPRRGNRVLSVLFAQLEESYFCELADMPSMKEEDVVKLGDLPISACRDYQRRLGDDIPEYLDLKYAIGEVIPDLCLAYLHKGKVAAFITFTKANGNLHLNSAYLQNKNFGGMLIYLLKYAWKRIKEDYAGYQVMTVTVINENAEQLFEKLLSGSSFDRRTVYETYKLIMDNDFVPMPTGYGGVYARTNSLVDALAEAGFGSIMYTQPGSMPVVTVPIYQEREMPCAYISYSAEGGESYDGFLLAIWSELDLIGVTEENRGKLLVDLNENGKVTEAYRMEELPDILIFNDYLHEEPAFDPEKPIAFIKEFLEQVKEADGKIDKRKR